MRIAIPWVILLSILVVSVTWWRGTMHADFLTPPSESELEEIQRRAEAAMPRADTPADAISVPEKKRRAAATEKPLVDIGELGGSPTLDEYADRASNGAAHLIELATLLEAEGQFQRTLLAWERVLDRTQADSAQIEAAVSVIKRLKPTLPDWNTDAEMRIPVLLQAGTGKTLAESVEPVLEKVARDLELASAGILSVTAKVNAARTDLVTDGPVPVALWLCGPGANAPSTDVLSFTVASPDSLENDCQRTAYQLIRGRFRESGDFARPTPLPEEGDPVDALESRITRWFWQAFGESLQTVGEEAESQPEE